MTAAKATNEIHNRPQPRCPLCDSAGVEIYTGLTDGLFGAPGRWNFRRCENPDCGLWWLDPMPLMEDLPKAYEHYSTHVDDSSSPDLRRRLTRATFRFALCLMGLDGERERSRSLYLSQKSPGRLLEVGCGSGTHLVRLRDQGWNVCGQEVDLLAAEVARKTYNLDVVVAPLESAGFAENSFDAVAMNHVIEHVVEPVHLLAECHRLLRPGGDLIVVTPNVDSFLHQHFRAYWRALEPPRHVHLFNPGTLRQAVHRAGFGDACCWTSTANAFSVATGSLYLRHHRPVDSLIVQCVGLWWQLRARLARVLDPNSGEECVLHVKKP